MAIKSRKLLDCAFIIKLASELESLSKHAVKVREVSVAILSFE
jgi:hypothetical protein